MPERAAESPAKAGRTGPEAGPGRSRDKSKDESKVPSTGRGTDEGAGGLLDRIGLPKTLLLGYVGVLLFMVGDGVESGFIAPYMADHGAGSDVRAGYVLTVYGVAVMLALASFARPGRSRGWGRASGAGMVFMLAAVHGSGG